jgi:hypothetical protein
LYFTLGKGWLKNLNLFVKKGKLIITTDKLSTKDITLIYNILVVFLQLLVFFVSLLDDVG